MENLFTLLGEARGVARVYAASYPPSPATSYRYRVAFAGWLSGGPGPEDARCLEDAVWLKAAIRFGAGERLSGLAAELEGALEQGDEGAAAVAADTARRCLQALDRYAAGVPGRRRPRAAQAVATA